MQYFKPDGDFFVGDCMPFFHDGVFRFFYLIDEGHHQALGGLGGHQWGQASTTDLRTWTHHPMAISITEEREGSICTGSVFYHDGLYYAFYATRIRDRSEHLSLAISQDGVRFEKTSPNPFFSPPEGYKASAWRDPVVFRNPDTGRFHLLVTAEREDAPLRERSGVLAHLVSDDLRRWSLEAPFLHTGFAGAPECPDYFFWRGWYYLVFSHQGIARYRMSRHPLGPWDRPRIDTLDSARLRVMKTAAFTGDRRIGAAWLSWRKDGRDDGAYQFGGNAVFRELVQNPDGSLGVTVPPELVPATVAPISGSTIAALTPGVSAGAGFALLDTPGSLGVAILTGLPHNAHISLRVEPGDGAYFGLRLCARPVETATPASSFSGGYDLVFSPFERTTRLRDETAMDMDGLDRPFTLDIMLRDDIVDVGIDNRRTLIDRCPERSGDVLAFFAHHASVRFSDITVSSLK